MSKDDYIIPEKNIVPKDWVSLSDDEIKALWQTYYDIGGINYARAIEQALRERNCNDTK